MDLFGFFCKDSTEDATNPALSVSTSVGRLAAHTRRKATEDPPLDPTRTLRSRRQKGVPTATPGSRGGRETGGSGTSPTRWFVRTSSTELWHSGCTVRTPVSPVRSHPPPVTPGVDGSPVGTCGTHPARRSLRRLHVCGGPDWDPRTSVRPSGYTNLRPQGSGASDRPRC